MSNGTDEPPPLEANYSAALFDLPTTTGRFHYSNSLRPYTEVTFVGPDAQPYIVGLLIVPFVLIGWLLVWLFVLALLGCLQECMARRHVALFNKPETRNRLWIIMLCLSFSAFVAWVCALGFAASTAASEGYLDDDLTALGNNILEVQYRLINASTYLTPLSNAMSQVQISCKKNTTKSADAIARLQNSVNKVTSSVDATTDSVVPITNTIAATLFDAAMLSYQIFTIRAAIIIVVSVIQVLLSITLLIVVIRGWRNVKSSAKCCACGCCCRRCCTPMFAFAVLDLCIVVILASVVHGIALLIADTCTPNVNINLNRVVAQFSNYQPFANYYGTNLTVMCDYFEEPGAPPAPKQLQYLCFYQTCDPTSDYVQTVISKIERAYNASQTAKASSDSQDILSIPQPTACESALAIVDNSLRIIVVNLLWALYYVSCSQINKIYAGAVYQSICNAQVYFSVNLFNSWVTGAVFLMLAMMFWLIFKDKMLLESTEPVFQGSAESMQKQLLESDLVDKTESFPLQQPDLNDAPPSAIKPPTTPVNKPIVDLALL
jgi:hypothetical protein